MAPKTPNYVWHLDLTTIRFLWMSFVVGAVMDGYSRKVLRLKVYAKVPSSAQLARLVANTSRRCGAPKHLVTDHGSQFRHAFRSAMQRLRIHHARGRVRCPAVNGKVERFFRTFRLWLRFALLPTNLRAGQARRSDAVGSAKSTSGSLRIALEYEAAFGRAALDFFLLSTIPDEHYAPGRLHTLLLQLPWSDVLTTNYDTLLERAAEQVVERQYDLVLTPSDIPLRQAPRIIKLHGSFPSTRPFIITEEDFRTYPTRAAPFVNLAQQVVMESSLVLIGFSGDDPNFLYWSGWVRDNLGEFAPQIYLCGLYGFTVAQQRMLHSRMITPIDLSPIVPREYFPNEPQRQSMAIEWFLLALAAGVPYDPQQWPNPVRVAPQTPPPGLPPIPLDARPVPISEPHTP